MVLLRSMVSPATSRSNEAKFSVFLGPKSNAWRSQVFGTRVLHSERRVLKFQRRRLAEIDNDQNHRRRPHFSLTVIAGLNRCNGVGMAVEDDRRDFIRMSNEEPLLMCLDVHLHQEGIGCVENVIIIRCPKDILTGAGETNHCAKTKDGIRKKNTCRRRRIGRVNGFIVGGVGRGEGVWMNEEMNTISIRRRRFTHGGQRWEVFCGIGIGTPMDLDEHVFNKTREEIQTHLLILGGC